jgi:hypothetical protein
VVPLIGYRQFDAVSSTPFSDGLFVVKGVAQTPGMAGFRIFPVNKGHHLGAAATGLVRVALFAFGHFFLISAAGMIASNRHQPSKR